MTNSQQIARRKKFIVILATFFPIAVAISLTFLDDTAQWVVLVASVAILGLFGFLVMAPERKARSRP